MPCRRSFSRISAVDDNLFVHVIHPRQIHIAAVTGAFLIQCTLKMRSALSKMCEKNLPELFVRCGASFRSLFFGYFEKTVNFFDDGLVKFVHKLANTAFGTTWYPFRRRSNWWFATNSTRPFRKLLSESSLFNQC